MLASEGTEWDGVDDDDWVEEVVAMVRAKVRGFAARARALSRSMAESSTE